MRKRPGDNALRGEACDLPDCGGTDNVRVVRYAFAFGKYGKRQCWCGSCRKKYAGRFKLVRPEDGDGG